ncbi:Uncharacterized protein PECH_004501 [Penicillium ucsense]|uniref:DUF7905 domain-containing protein n=1 Tax=Penicillium ucsense TaxID=2839758 RepID=A0A8J8W3S7_9EURO|nr:Uncharacterized protein PECM_004794 [Penicillium ucsense]KAF7737012.1 Uncharacterized protein PECH_004501 [Penicillium ucsense]
MTLDSPSRKIEHSVESSEHRTQPANAPQRYATGANVLSTTQNSSQPKVLPQTQSEISAEVDLIDLDSPPSSPKPGKKQNTSGSKVVDPLAESQIPQLPVTVTPKTAQPKAFPIISTHSTAEAQGDHPEDERSANLASQTQVASAETRYHDGSKPDCILNLGDFVGVGKASVASLFPTKTSIAERNQDLERIARLTGAHIKPPVDSDTEISIWGTTVEVDAAKVNLQKLVIRYRDRLLAGEDRPSSPDARAVRPTLSARPRPQRLYQTRNRKPQPWSKLSVYHSIEQQNRKRAVMALGELRKAPHRLEQMNKLLFLWPDDGPSPHEWLGDDLEKLDNLRLDLQCHVFVDPRNERDIIVTSTDGFDTAHVVNILRTAWKEATRDINMHMKKLLLAPMNEKGRAMGIVIAKGFAFSRPLPQASQARESSTADGDLSPLVDVQCSRNGKIIEECLRASISRINWYNDTLRLRFRFGTFILEKYRYPENGTKLFRPDEFEAMIGHTEARGRLAAGLKIGTSELLRRFHHANDLLEPINQERSLEELELMEPVHSATVEILRSPDSQCRLELYLKQIRSTGEVEIKGQRWFQARQGSDQLVATPLQLAMIDFNRADWQCTIESFKVVRDRELTKAQQELASGIRFVSTCDNQYFGAAANMSIFVPRGTMDVRIVKKSALLFRVKKTNLTLELSRFDVYENTSFLRTQYGATLHDPKWDTLTEEITSAKSDSEPSPTVSLEAFFPKPSDSTLGEDEANGLQYLLMTVQRLAELLGGPELGLNKKARGEKMANVIDLELGTLF